MKNLILFSSLLFSSFTLSQEASFSGAETYVLTSIGIYKPYPEFIIFAKESKPELFKLWKKRFIKEVAEIDQPSAKWTSIQILNELFDQLDEKEKTQSVEICLRYLRNEEDWIVINQSLNFMRNHLERFDFKDPEMMKLLKYFVNDERKSISKNAEKLIKILPCMNGSIRCKNDFLVHHNSNAILKLDPPGR